MTHLSLRQMQQIMQYLRNVAEVDPNDEVANHSSQLSIDMEVMAAPLNFNKLSQKQQQLIKYAISKRNVYKLLPGEKHACVVK